MNFWRILAGDPPHQPKILGDWLIGEFISLYRDPITTVKGDPTARLFVGKDKDSMQVGDKVVIYTNKCVYGLGEITGQIRIDKNPPAVKDHPYANWRKIYWIRVCRTKSSRLPPSARGKLVGDPSHYIKKLSPEVWETLILLS